MPVIPSASAYAEGAAGSTFTITHPPVGGTFAKDAPLRLYVQAYSPDNHLLTYQWYRSDTATGAGTPIDGQTSSILDTKTSDVPGTTYYYAEVTDATVAGSTARSDAAVVSVQDWTVHDEDQTTAKDPVPTSTAGSRPFWLELQNGGFECTTKATVAGNSTIYYENLPGWHTTITSMDPNYQGKRIIEVANANATYKVPNLPGSSLVAELASTDVSCLFQEVATQPGKIYSWKLDHHGREGGSSGNDVMAVVIGPALTQEETESLVTANVIKGGSDFVTYPYGTNATRTEEKSLFNAIVNALKVQVGGTLPSSGEYVVPYVLPTGSTRNYYVSMTSDPRVANASWGHYAGTYTVPEGQGSTVFAFANISSGSNGYGNLLDNVEFKAGSGIDVSTSVDYEGDGRLLVNNVQDGYVYGIVEERGSTTMAVAPTVELDGVAVDEWDKEGTSGWYLPGAGETLVFGGLVPGKTYRVVGVPVNAANAVTKSNLTPGFVLDDGYYKSITVKAVADGSDGVQVTASLEEGGATASVTVRPANANVEYALLGTDESGNPDPAVVASAGMPGAVDGGWVSTDQGSLTFPGLGLSTADAPRHYAVVARPKGYSEVGFADQVAAGAAVVVATPSAAFADVTPAGVSRTKDAPGTVTVKNEGQGSQRYLVYDVAAGPQASDVWQTLAKGEERDFAVEADGTYQVVSIGDGEGAVPARGVRSYPAAPEPVLNYVKETVGKDDTVPTTVEFRMHDVETNAWYFGGPDGSASPWVRGTGGSALVLTGALDAMKAGGAGAEITYRLHADFEPAVHVESAFAVPARPAAPDDPSAWYTFDYENEKLIPRTEAAVEARTSDKAAWADASKDAGLALSALGWTGSAKVFQLRLAAVEGADAASSAFASAVADATVPARPAVPNVGVLLEEGGTTYRFTGADDEVGASEYREYGTSDGFKTCSDVSDLVKGKTYEVRKAASNTSGAFASETLLRAASEAQLEAVVSGAFPDNVKFGYSSAPSATLRLSNSGKTSAEVKGTDDATAEKKVVVTMLDHPVAYTDPSPAFVVEGSGGTVAGTDDGASAGTVSDLSWTIKAADSLPAGTYRASVSIPYTDGTKSGDETVYLAALSTVSLVVGKADPDPPKDLAFVGATATTAALSAVSGDLHGLSIEFSTSEAFGNVIVGTADAGAAASVEFTGLKPATSYTFYARTQADDNHNASSPVSLSRFTAYAAPDADVVSMNFVAEAALFGSAYEARSDKDDESTALVSDGRGSLTAVLDASDAADGRKIWVRCKAKEGASGAEGFVPASEWTEVPVPVRPDAPALTVTGATDSASTDGSIFSASPLALLDGAGVWVSYNIVDGLAPGGYTVRAQATGTAFASKPTAATVGVRNHLVTFHPNGGSWEGGSTEPKTVRVPVGAPATGYVPALSRDKFKLDGWYTSTDGGATFGDLWDAGAAVTADVGVYAGWSAAEYAVRFDPGVEAGAVPAVTGTMDDQPFVYGVAQGLSACGFKRATYVFAGWATERGGAVVYAGKGEEVSNLTTVDGATVTLYAVWARPAISAAVPVNATVVVDANGSFRCPSALDPDNPDAGGYFISSTTPYPLKVESVAFGLAEGAGGIFTEAAKMQATVNGLAVGADTGAVGTSPAAGAFKLAASAGGAPVRLPLSLSLAYPGGTMTYSSSERPFATLTYKLAFDDEAAASGEGV